MSLLYITAGRILRDFQNKKGSLKSLVFNSSLDLRRKKKLFAILCRTIKHKDDLEQVIESCKLTEKEPQLFRSYQVGVVILCDALYGRGVRCGGRFKMAIKRNLHQLKAALQSIEQSKSSSEMKNGMDGINDISEGTSSYKLPKYARINTLKTSVDCFLEMLDKEEFICKSFEEIIQCSCINMKDTVIQVGSIKSLKNCYCLDSTVPGLLVFCNCTSLTGTEWYSQSLLILQDKASCLPAHILSPHEQSVVIDTCAAPGNKTTHLASITKDTGLIYAFDKDPKRVGVLRQRVDEAGARNVQVQQKDFLKVVPAAFSNVKYILVDPSCSGTGIYNRLEYGKNAPDKDRLQSLASFQCKILNHALSFPNVEKVVYSTCSVHKEENELVVRRVLLENASKFDLVHVLPEWSTRGLPVFTKASHCIRSSVQDGTNGFFVAMFKKK